MRFFLALLIVCTLALTGCLPPPNPQKIAEANEKILATEGIMQLKPGDKAPAFTADTATGERVLIGAGGGAAPTTQIPAAEATAPSSDTAAAPGQTAPPVKTAAPPKQSEANTYTVLYFYPADFTPNSTKNLQELSKGQPDLDAQQIKVYGITTGTADQHRAYMEKERITVSLLVDAGSVCKSYGTLLEGGQYPQRTLVGIKPDGTIGFYMRGIAHAKLPDLILKESGRTPPKQ